MSSPDERTTQSVEEREAEPCRHCGTETVQRADGKPYCSMDCIEDRRRFLKEEAVTCPYPGCTWEARYLPRNRYMKRAAYRDAEEHREAHRRVRGDLDAA